VKDELRDAAVLWLNVVQSLVVGRWSFNWKSD
jgi:hypothetical protein